MPWGKLKIIFNQTQWSLLSCESGYCIWWIKKAISFASKPHKRKSITGAWSASTWGVFSTEQMSLERIHERCIMPHTEAHLFEGQTFKKQQQHDRCQFILTESFLKDLLWKKWPWVGNQECNSINMSADLQRGVFFFFLSTDNLAKYSIFSGKLKFTLCPAALINYILNDYKKS